MPPVFAHGALRLYLLSLLEDGPRHGYELIKALSDRFNGTYSPSAGTIYPRLSKLEEEGLVRTETEGRRTVYILSDAGRAELDSRRAEVGAVEEDINSSVRSRADQLRQDIGSNIRSLKEELSTSGRQQRARAQNATQPGVQDPWTPEAPLGGRHQNLRDAERVLGSFRSELLMALRVRRASGDITDAQLSTLRHTLGETLNSVRNTLSN